MGALSLQFHFSINVRDRLEAEWEDGDYCAVFHRALGHPSLDSLAGTPDKSDRVVHRVERSGVQSPVLVDVRQVPKDGSGNGMTPTTVARSTK